MTWDCLSTLPPLRDEHGTIVLEEADDDTQTATFRIYGRTSLTATVTPTNEVQFSADPPESLRTALKGTVPMSPSDADLVSEPTGVGTVPLSRWVAAGVAAAGIAVLAARRRR